MLQTARNATAKRRPGKTPARNSAPIETFETSAYRIIGIDGGIIRSMIGALEFNAAQKGAG
jgi:hypothetical protein